MNRGGFSWSRFVGLAALKGRVGRKIGVPLTESGRNQKIGRMVMGSGKWFVLLLIIGIMAKTCGN